MRSPALFSLIVAPLVSACQGAVWGNIALFFLAVGIFMGTVTLGRRR